LQNLYLGTSAIDVDGPVVAGAYQTVTLTYTAGHPVDDSGYVKIAFRFAGDFGVPQFEDPAGPNYCTVSTTGDCRIQPRWDPKGHTRPWGRALYLKVLGGFLNTGEQVAVVFGDTSGGSPGWQIQTFCEATFEFKTLVDPIATYEFKERTGSPLMTIVAGEPVRAVCIAPSQVEAGSPFTFHLKLEDRWGNPSGPVQLIARPGFADAGVRRVRAGDRASGLTALSNPIEVVTDPQELHPFWGDLHGQSEETIGSNSIDDYFTFARDYARLDVASHQGNDFQITDELWDTINDAAERYDEAGSFVTFPGYEWSGNTPLGGDRNVYFTGPGGRIVHSCADLLPGKRSMYKTAPTAAELFTTLAKQTTPRANARHDTPRANARQDPSRAFAYAHVGGRYADLTMHDAVIELAVEVHSAWGTFEWLVEDALRLGYRVGICANSDGHKGRPGASYPGARKFGSYGGLTCFLSRNLTREAIFEALESRRFFATTGNRCLVDVRLMSGDRATAMMGDLVSSDGGPLALRVHVTGTAAIESVDVRNGAEVLQTLRPYGQEDLGNRVKVVWRGAEVKGRERLSTWDGCGARQLLESERAASLAGREQRGVALDHDRGPGRVHSDAGGAACGRDRRGDHPCDRSLPGWRNWAGATRLVLRRAGEADRDLPAGQGRARTRVRMHGRAGRSARGRQPDLHPRHAGGWPHGLDQPDLRREGIVGPHACPYRQDRVRPTAAALSP